MNIKNIVKKFSLFTVLIYFFNNYSSDLSLDQALYKAIASNDIGLVKRLVTPLNFNNFNGPDYSLLEFSMYGNCNEISEYLLQCGINIDFIDKFGTTRLITAVYNNSFKDCELLLKYGANPNFCDIQGNTAISIAQNMNHFAIKALLFLNINGNSLKDLMITGGNEPER